METAHSTTTKVDVPERPSGVSAGPVVASLPAFRYSMMFALSEDLKSVLLLCKPSTHRNPLFRGRWTAPGGHVEVGENELDGTLREMEEETGLRISSSDTRFILRFSCNCDPLEAEHEVAVYAATLPLTALKLARGQAAEPLHIFSYGLPDNSLWYMNPLLAMVIFRLRQPL